IDFQSDRPSQPASFSGSRTVLIRQAFIAAIASPSVGPTHIPQPCAHAYSKLERLTPRRRTVRPLPSTNRLPRTEMDRLPASDRVVTTESMTTPQTTAMLVAQSAPGRKAGR